MPATNALRKLANEMTLGVVGDTNLKKYICPHDPVGHSIITDERQSRAALWDISFGLYRKPRRDAEQEVQGHWRPAQHQRYE